MKDNQKKPLQVALLGMDGRSYKTMSMFLNGPCKGEAVVADEAYAEVDIVDADTIGAKQVVEKSLAREPQRPVIILSLQPLSFPNTQAICLKKPVITDSMLEALKSARDICEGKGPKKGLAPPAAPQQAASPASAVPQQQFVAGSSAAAQPTPAPTSSPSPVSAPAQASVKPAQPQPVENKKIVDAEEQKKTAKHTSTIQLDEKGFTAFIGTVPGIDLNDPQQQRLASYNPKEFFLGFVQSACKIAFSQKRVMKLNSAWKPLIILPHSREIWVDADDKMLRAFAGVPVNASAVSLAPVDAHSLAGGIDVSKIQEMDAFLWKLAIWSSKGRYPLPLDIDQPVYLRRWPNFTRYIVTPHALRISALLIDRGPQTMSNISSLLNVELRYVNVFISAVYALGLAAQAQRQADALVRPEVVSKAPEKKGILGRIINKLRGGES